MQGFPVVAIAAGYSLTWCHSLLMLTEISSLLELKYSPQSQPGTTAKTETEGKKKRQGIGTARDARNHVHEERCNPCLVPLNALQGLSVTAAEILWEHFAMSRPCPLPKARRRYGTIFTCFGDFSHMDPKSCLRGDSGDFSLIDCPILNSSFLCDFMVFSIMGDFFPRFPASFHAQHRHYLMNQ